VALLAGEMRSEQDKEILAVYEQILQEEGFPYRVVWPEELTRYAPGELKSRYQAIVAPEVINSVMPRETCPGQRLQYILLRQIRIRSYQGAER